MFKDPERMAISLLIIAAACAFAGLLGFGVSRWSLMYQEDSAKLECRRSGRYVVTDRRFVGSAVVDEWRCSVLPEKSP